MFHDVYIGTLLQEAFAPLAKGLPSVVEVLKKQLTLSESTVRDLRDQIHTLHNTVEQLTHENNGLKQNVSREWNNSSQPGGFVRCKLKSDV